MVAVAVVLGRLALDVAKLRDGLRAQSEGLENLQESLRAGGESLRKLQERLRIDAELARTIPALQQFQSNLESRKFEFEHGLSCLAFLELLSRKPNFDAFAADAEGKLSKTLYSKAVFDIEGVNYATKDADHPMTRELKACVAPNAGQDRIPFPDELSVLVFKDRFDAQIDAVFTARFHLVLNALATVLIEYDDLMPPAKRLIDADVGDQICQTSVRRLVLRKSESAVIRAKFSDGRLARIERYVGAKCPG